MPTPELVYANAIRDAVRHFWQTRSLQTKQQKKRKAKDQGSRSAVTGGKQMDGFIRLFREIAIDAGLPESSVFVNSKLELPGYFRAEKKWDFIVIHDKKLVAVIETKSQVGSLGNNFNNRTEEALGNAQDVWTAYREGAFGTTTPWIGFLFLLEDSPASTQPVRVQEPHFKVFDEFRETSYAKRYEILMRKLMLERHYSQTALLLSSPDGGQQGLFREPAPDLASELFLCAFQAHLKAAIK